MNCWNRLSPGTAQRHCKHIFQSRSFQKEAADGNETGSCWIRTPWVNYLCVSMSDSCKSFCPNCASWAFVLQARPAHLLIGCASCGELGRFPSEPHPNPAGPLRYSMWLWFVASLRCLLLSSVWFWHQKHYRNEILTEQKGLLSL